MRKYLLSETGTFYKANLHCHTTVSDGHTTPEETKQAYMEMGYSIIAFTDHRKFVSHNDLTDDKFLALNGIEADTYEKNVTDWSRAKVCHLCVIALDENMRSVPGCKRLEYSGESVTAYIKECRENGCFVTYNHPFWSLESYPEYMSYKGANALEIVNYGCVVEGYLDRNDKAYDDMLRGGERLFAIAADDNHGRSHFFGGYTMIKADSLTYKDISKALTGGNFYASESGPDILELYVEDGKLYIKTDSAREIFLTTDKRFRKRVLGNEAVFDLQECIYFRLTAIDDKGNASYTNAYFTDSL